MSMFRGPDGRVYRQGLNGTAGPAGRYESATDFRPGDRVYVYPGLGPYASSTEAAEVRGFDDWWVKVVARGQEFPVDPKNLKHAGHDAPLATLTVPSTYVPNGDATRAVRELNEARRESKALADLLAEHSRAFKALEADRDVSRATIKTLTDDRDAWRTRAERHQADVQRAIEGLAQASGCLSGNLLEHVRSLRQEADRERGAHEDARNVLLRVRTASACPEAVSLVDHVDGMRGAVAESSMALREIRWASDCPSGSSVSEHARNLVDERDELVQHAVRRQKRDHVLVALFALLVGIGGLGGFLLGAFAEARREEGRVVPRFPR
jgi:hypothetical protein